MVDRLRRRDRVLRRTLGRRRPRYPGAAVPRAHGRRDPPPVLRVRPVPPYRAPALRGGRRAQPDDARAGPGRPDRGVRTMTTLDEVEALAARAAAEPENTDAALALVQVAGEIYG